MTSVQAESERARRPGPARSRSDAAVRNQLTTRRPIVPTAVFGGALAAAGPLLVVLALALVGWFLTDAGSHGSPSGALRVGALGWLMAHGSGVVVEGVSIGAMPLGLTLLCGWTAWRIGNRVGEAVAGHGPDADRIADGERDWTVHLAGGLFVLGYLVVAVVTCSIADSPATQPSLQRVVGMSLLLSAAVGVPAIARGSGRAAIWLPGVPVGVRAAALVMRRILLLWWALSAVVLLVAFAADFATAANITEQLGATGGTTFLLALLTLLVVPNAMLFTGSYLMGPGFTLGTSTIVSPGAVVLGPLPMFPLLAALPHAGPQPGWTAALILSPVVVAAIAAGLLQKGQPARWDRAALRGCGAGLAAGVVVAFVSLFAGGAVGPGRMADVGVPVFEVLLHAVTGFGIGGLLGSLAMVGWQTRSDLIAKLRR